MITLRTAIVTGAAALAGLIAQGAEAKAVRCDPNSARGCGLDYYIKYVYRSGGKAELDFSAQHEWMVAATTAVSRGVSQRSGYTSIYVGDRTTGEEVKAVFCATGATCPIVTATVHEGRSTTAGWSQSYVAQCPNVQSHLRSRHGREAEMWSYYLHDAGEADRNAIPYAGLRSPKGNTTATTSYDACLA